MDFSLSDEQRQIVDTTRAFVEKELFPHESEVERTGELRPELRETIKTKAIARNGDKGSFICRKSGCASHSHFTTIQTQAAFDAQLSRHCSRSQQYFPSSTLRASLVRSRARRRISASCACTDAEGCR